MFVSQFANIRSVVVGLLSISLFVSLSKNVVAVLTQEPAGMDRPTRVQVNLSAAYTTNSWDERGLNRPAFELPKLVLHRQRDPAPEADRTLELSISGFTGGSQVQVEAVSFHVDVSTGARHTVTASFGLPDRGCTQKYPCVFQWMLDPLTMPSDFYTLNVRDNAGNFLWLDSYPERPDFVALDTWDVALGRGSAGRDVEYSARVYYATLFPFAKGQDGFDNRLSPAAVTDFIEEQFVPVIVETWHTQVVEWGFGDPLHPDWDADGVVDIIITDHPFALFGGTGTYAGSMTSEGRPLPDRRIWWLSSLDNFSYYDSLEDAYKATFVHEFFHLMQWNVRLGTGRPEKYWLNVFLEAQAAAAASIQYPETELGKSHAIFRGSEYVRAANSFLTERFNTSYADLAVDKANRYDAALYWRFLYEQFGGMAILRAALEEMARSEEIDVVGGMDDALDRAFARFDGPFHSFEESLVAFARANYALRLENGRCTGLESGACWGIHYDPDEAYVDPPLEATLDFDGTRLVFEDNVPASFGTDLVEVRLNPGMRDQPFRLEFQGEGENSQFCVQVWQIGPGPMKPRAISARPDILPQTPDGVHVYVISQVDTTLYDRLGIIITRLDSDEMADREGVYAITLNSAGG